MSDFGHQDFCNGNGEVKFSILKIYWKPENGICLQYNIYSLYKVTVIKDTLN